MRVGLLVVRQSTMIRLLVNCAARVTNYHMINTLAMSVVFAPIAVTVRSRLRRRQSHYHRHWHHPDP